MSQEIVKKEFKKNYVLLIMNSSLKENSNVEAKEKSQREIGMLRIKSKRKITLRPGATYAQCFSGGNFASQYEDECPVNYSLKYSETESCKCINKCETMKKKFKDYADYAETDLDQPTDFSLKYAEKTYDDENKNIAFGYYNNHKVKFKEYTDYVETDLEQPTDFTLKYRESADEDIKNLEFPFYENEERKPPTVFANRTVAEDPCERLQGRFASQDETPLMFSRSSSLNSLSSFVHITQSIPDDRSSVVSDFSRMTSGIISPSELPDSPTQTAPSSPKRVKPAVAFPSKPDFTTKQSVFEDDVATYKQEDTPIEFSRATSLSSLNIENPLKSELVIKQPSPGMPCDMSKEGVQNGEELVHSEHLKQELAPEKIDQDKGKFELVPVLEVDESLFADCISIDIQINCRKSKPNSGRLMVANEGGGPFRPNNAFHLKPNCRLRCHNDSRKGYAPYELSDDAVHTYHTEGTPANVSHAGSHSDLSTLSIASGIPVFGADDNSDSDCFFPEGTDGTSKTKTDPLRAKMEVRDGSDADGRSSSTSKGSQMDYPRKDQLTAKDETASYAVENGPCDFLASSLGDLTVDVMNPPLSIASAENFEEAPSQMLSPLRNVSPQSPNSIVFEEVDDVEKGSEEFENELVSSETEKERNDAWGQPNGSGQPEQTAEDINTICSSAEYPTSTNIDLDSNLPLTAFEEALLEECIRLGMPQKRKPKQLQETHFKLNDECKPSEERELNYSKSVAKEGKWWNGKKCSDLRFAGCESQLLCEGASTPNSVHGDNFDFDSSEPLTPFEEVLLEQCIQLGMPQKKTSLSEGALLKDLDAGAREFDCDFAGLITPLETALVEQCIRLGMPQKKKRENGVSGDESHKAVPCLTVHLNRLRLNAENEKDKDSLKKCDNCPCGRRHAYRRRNTSCRRIKSKSDHFKVESCPV